MAADARTGEAIVRAERLLPEVSVDDDTLEVIATLSVDLGVDGHRSDVAMVKTVSALAAFRGRTRIEEADLAEAAALVYPHRVRKTVLDERILSEEETVTSIRRTRDKQQARSPGKFPKKKVLA